MRVKLLSVACAFAVAVMSLSCIDGSHRQPVDSGLHSPLFSGDPPVLINEVYSANLDFMDENGNTPGWVEFYNPSGAPANLNGYVLTNNPSRQMWTFGDVTVEPYSYLTVFMSGRNRPDFMPPSNQTDLIRSAVGAWSWADDQAEPAPGNSTVEHTFVQNTSIGGSLHPKSSTALSWASSVIMMVLNGWETTDAVDISNADQIIFRGKINAGAPLMIGLAQDGVDDWESWSATLTGTGREDELYTLNLPAVNTGFPDLTKIYGIRFANPPSHRGLIEFSFNSITAQKRAGNVHVSFELGNTGGRLYLVDQQGSIRDSVAYPAATRGLSYARMDGGGWKLSNPPTPNAANEGNFYDSQVQLPTEGLPASGYYESPLSFTLPPESDQGATCCDTTGALPTMESAIRSGVTLHIARTTVLRCIQFKSGSYASEPVLRTYIVGEQLTSLPIVSIAIDPVAMFDPTTGLYMPGPNASPAPPHYGANYHADTELPMHIEFFENGAKLAWSHPAGLRMFGGWSRANAKKSALITFRDIYGGPNNLRYPLIPSHPHLTRFKHFLLRNNGNNFDQDYIRDMLMSSLTEGLGMDYQKGRPVIVYYNGQYYGIHNLRERSNADYFRTNYNINDDNIDLVKASNGVSSGSDMDYQNIVSWLNGIPALNDDNLRELDGRIDISDFTNHHQFRIYYVDKDWPGNNMKRWRQNSPTTTRWKWFMYDTDHGFGSHGQWTCPSVPMLRFATDPNGPCGIQTSWPNPPHTTFMLRKLLTNESYKHGFINRFSLLIATYFVPERVDSRINELMAPIAGEIQRDQQRWGHDTTRMSSQLEVIRNFGRSRPEQMRRELEQFFEVSNPVDVTLKANGAGKILVAGLEVMNGQATFKAYAAAPIALKAVPAGPGVEFLGWSDGVFEMERTVTVHQTQTLEARFDGTSVKPRGTQFSL